LLELVIKDKAMAFAIALSFITATVRRPTRA